MSTIHQDWDLIYSIKKKKEKAHLIEYLKRFAENKNLLTRDGVVLLSHAVYDICFTEKEDIQVILPGPDNVFDLYKKVWTLHGFNSIDEIYHKEKELKKSYLKIESEQVFFYRPLIKSKANIDGANTLKYYYSNEIISNVKPYWCDIFDTGKTPFISDLLSDMGWHVKPSEDRDEDLKLFAKQFLETSVEDMLIKDIDLPDGLLSIMGEYPLTSYSFDVSIKTLVSHATSPLVVSMVETQKQAHDLIDRLEIITIPYRWEKTDSLAKGGLEVKKGSFLFECLEKNDIHKLSDYLLDVDYSKVLDLADEKHKAKYCEIIKRVGVEIVGNYNNRRQKIMDDIESIEVNKINPKGALSILTNANIKMFTKISSPSQVSTFDVYKDLEKVVKILKTIGSDEVIHKMYEEQQVKLIELEKMIRVNEDSKVDLGYLTELKIMVDYHLLEKKIPHSMLDKPAKFKKF